jgi:branched-chain amino acid transport system substrate-binding protein
MKLIRACAAGLAMVLVLVPGIGRTAGEPVVVPVVNALTGPAALLGTTYKKTFELFEKAVNDTGGINGRPVQFEFLDDASNPATAVQVVTQLMSRNVPIFIGPGVVATCRAVAPLVVNGPVHYCTSPGGPTPKGGFSFAGGFTTPDAIKAAVHYFHERGVRRVAILQSTDATGQDGEHALDEALALPENHDMTVVAREHYNPADISVAAQLSRIKAANADWLFSWVSGAPFGTVLHGMSDAGIDLPVYTSHANLLYSAMAQFGGFAPKAGLYFAGPRLLARGQLRGASRTAVDGFFKAYTSAGIRPDVGASYVWDVGLVIVDALRHAGPHPTAAGLRDYIEGLHGLAGAAADFDFRDGSQRGISSTAILITRWDPQAQDFVAVSEPGGKPLAR